MDSRHTHIIAAFTDVSRFGYYKFKEILKKDFLIFTFSINIKQYSSPIITFKSTYKFLMVLFKNIQNHA